MAGSARRAWALGIAATTLSLGCGRVLGVDEYEVAPGESDDGGPAGAAADGAPMLATGGQCGGFVYSDDACASCMPGACCDVLEACRKDRTCAAWEECVSECTPDDGACHAACAGDIERTNGAMADVLACKLGECPGCSRPEESGALLGGAECATCFRQRCGPELRKYEGCPACVEQVACYTAIDTAFAPDPGKRATCGGVWLSPVDSIVQEFIACVGLRCAAQCGLGSAIDCAGEYQYPTRGEPVVRLRVRVGEGPFLSTASPHPEATVVQSDPRGVKRDHPECRAACLALGRRGRAAPRIASAIGLPMAPRPEHN